MDNRSAEERFECKVDRSGLCHIWIAGIGTDGYGKFTLHSQTVRAHRIALEWKLGRPLAPGMLALHTCDNPPCVNEDHLYEGTAQNNMDDKFERQRSRVRSGSDHPNARLSEEDVANIKALYENGVYQYVIGQRYGISQAHVSNLVRGKRYAA